MDETNQDDSQVLETSETDTGAVETTVDALSAEEVAALKAEAAKAKELEAKNKQLFERAKKAEEAAKARPDAPSQELSTKDVLYLSGAGIPVDDVDDVISYASKMGVSIKDAHDFYKPILAERAEQRKTAAVTHTKGGARGTTKATGADFLAKAEQTQEVPETEEAMRALQEARLARKKNK